MPKYQFQDVVIDFYKNPSKILAEGQFLIDYTERAEFYILDSDAQLVNISAKVRERNKNPTIEDFQKEIATALGDKFSAEYINDTLMPNLINFNQSQPVDNIKHLQQKEVFTEIEIPGGSGSTPLYLTPGKKGVKMYMPVNLKLIGPDFKDKPKHETERAGTIIKLTVPRDKTKECIRRDYIKLTKIDHKVEGFQSAPTHKVLKVENKVNDLIFGGVLLDTLNNEKQEDIKAFSAKLETDLSKQVFQYDDNKRIQKLLKDVKKHIELEQKSLKKEGFKARLKKFLRYIFKRPKPEPLKEKLIIKNIVTNHSKFKPHQTTMIR